ncbi:unnamed protein product [Adineta steineri]|uniref:Uncharacterized protein n=2 Tax=Adineta steineri TaxID=433720 RepID=A0A815TVX8_9BILA|nr:unnamed protein product [Adineta steineri]
MEDGVLLSSLYEKIDKNSKTDDVIQTKLLTHTSSFPSEPEIKSKIIHRQYKPSKYESPMSDRESWWRVTIKDTPIPGSYDTHLNTFIKETIARPMTYGFKSDGRRRDPQPLEPKGKDLLPGAYSHGDSIDEMLRRRLSYGFKGPTREESLKKTVLANHDKDIDVAPGLYETQKYHRIDVPIEPVRHGFFKSKSKRKLFPPKDGPAPGDYEPKTKIIDTKSPTIRSSFQSRTDRFYKRPMKVPGPGTYDILSSFPSWKQIDMFSTNGIYFNGDFPRV